jgi:hypothetical protein
MKPPQIKPPVQDQAPISPLIGGFVLAATAAMKPLLRPSARRDLARFIATIKWDGEAKEFVRWAARVLEAHRAGSKSIRRGRAATAILETALPIFRRPSRAYRPRSIF